VSIPVLSVTPNLALDASGITCTIDTVTLDSDAVSGTWSTVANNSTTYTYTNGVFQFVIDASAGFTPSVNNQGVLTLSNTNAVAKNGSVALFTTFKIQATGADYNALQGKAISLTFNFAGTSAATPAS
jgi:hypothetical protein